MLHPDPTLRTTAIFILTAASLCLNLPATASTIYVSADAAGANGGSSWADAYTDLQSALTQAVAGDEIWVKAGTYKPTTGTDRNATFQLVSGVGLYGGFDGTESSRDQRDWHLYETILSGNIGALGQDVGISNSQVPPSDINLHRAPFEPGQRHATTPRDARAAPNGPAASAKSYHVVTGSGTDRTAILDGFTVGGGGEGESALIAGGGMINSAGSPTVRHTTFTGNVATYGGGIYNGQGSAPQFIDVTITSNRTLNGWGAGMYSDESSIPTIASSRVLNNWAAFGGGGIFGGDADVCDVLFSGNVSSDAAGGMLCVGGVIERVTFLQNTSVQFGAGLLCTGDAVLKDVLFVGNAKVGGSYGGGGLAILGGAPSLINVVFRDNSADLGGALYSRGSPVLINVTIAGNHASYRGGGIYLAVDNGGAVTTPHFINTILWGNSADSQGPNLYVEQGTPEFSHSLVQGSRGSGASWLPYFGIDGGGNLDLDPQFVDAPNGELRLTIASPAVNAGDTSALPSGVTTDLDGNPRVFGPGVDIGAYELQVPIVPTFGAGVQLTAQISGKEVELRWRIDDRHAVDHLELRRSIDAVAERSIAIWERAAIASEGSWVDSQLSGGQNVVYRLLGAVHGARLELARVGVQFSPGPSARSRLLAAAPNPFNPSTEIRYELAVSESVTLEIFDLAGRIVRELNLGERPRGPGSMVWDGRDDGGHALASAVYLVRLRTRTGTSHLPVVMAR